MIRAMIHTYCVCEFYNFINARVFFFSCTGVKRKPIFSVVLSIHQTENHRVVDNSAVTRRNDSTNIRTYIYIYIYLNV